MTRLILVPALVFGCTGCDQLTENYARAHLRPSVTSSYLLDTVRVVYSENAGAFLSAGESLSRPMRTALFQVGVAVLVLGSGAAALFGRGLGRAQVAALALLILLLRSGRAPPGRTRRA